MKTKTILVAAVALFLLASGPATTNAAEAYKINDTNVLFMIDFNVTAEGSMYEVPVIASSRVRYNDRVDMLGYKLVSSDPNVPSIATGGIVLSNAAIEGDRYVIENGESQNFTLVVLASFTEAFNGDVLASITKLPYWIDGQRTTVHQNQLDELDTSALTAK